jgi:hypothetical protein
MQLTYRFDDQRITIIETENGSDTEFKITIIDEETMLANFKEVQKRFEHNDTYTDALFYAYEHHQYKVIVRGDHYVDFIMALMGHQLLKSVEWI